MAERDMSEVPESGPDEPIEPGPGDMPEPEAPREEQQHPGPDPYPHHGVPPQYAYHGQHQHQQAPPGYQQAPAGYQQPYQQQPMPAERRGGRGGVVAGLILIGLGVLFLIDEFTGIDIGRLWPLILIIIGISIMLGGRRR